MLVLLCMPNNPKIVVTVSTVTANTAAFSSILLT